MPKRFTDTEKWKKKFIKFLPPTYKLLWFYILDDCDHAGIWHPDFEVASIRIGGQVDEDEAEQYFKDQIQIFDDGEKWFIPAFIEFQYGELNPNNRAHNSVINKLKNYKLGAYKLLNDNQEGVKVKDKVKDEVKVKVKVSLEDRKKSFFNELLTSYKHKYPKKMLQDFFDYWTEHGEKDTKMRFEKEKVFGLSRRLATWKSRSTIDYSKNEVNFDSTEMNKHKL